MFLVRCWRSLCAASLWPGAAGAQIVLGLADVLVRAREQAPQIVIARLAVAEAQGRIAGASLRLQMNPELDLNAGNRQGDGTRSTDLQFGVNQMFEPRRAPCGAHRGGERRGWTRARSPSRKPRETCCATRRGCSIRRSTPASASGC